MMPIQSSWIPPRKYIGTTVDAQPGIAVAENNRIHSAQATTRKLATEMSRPILVMARKGAAENEVMPYHAKETIFRRGYFDSPANRSARS